MLWDVHHVLRVSLFMCTFAAAKVRIALARRLSIPCKRTIYLQFGRSDEFLFKWVCEPRKSKMTLKKKKNIFTLLLKFKLKCQD